MSLLERKWIETGWGSGCTIKESISNEVEG